MQSDNYRELTSLFFTASRHIKETMRANGCTGDVSVLQLESLFFIFKKEPTMTELADYLSVAPPSATSLVESLVADGYVDRVPDKDDRRIVRIKVSGKGLTKITATREKAAEHMKKILEPLTDEEKQSLKTILEKIISPTK